MSPIDNDSHYQLMINLEPSHEDRADIKKKNFFFLLTYMREEKNPGGHFGAGAKKKNIFSQKIPSHDATWLLTV